MFIRRKTGQQVLFPGECAAGYRGHCGAYACGCGARPAPAAATASQAWVTLKRTFFNDKSGLTEKTLWSYNQAFSGWEAFIGSKPIGEIRRPDVKAFADFLRDKENPRGGKLDHKTIQRSLGHIKTFMMWAVAAGHAVDDRFETVAGRDMTTENQ
ncbi:MAG: hypothetical protein PHE40_05995 [Acidocella sp.]|nr:hypothetical protein [Acidocella sp.]MDD2795389.1 hypothetical protein [Acidocella sp.]